MAEFDKYASDYVDYINKSSAITGEKYEYFVNLRISLMIEKLKGIGFNPNSRIRILDYGCGIGITEICLKNFFKNSEIYGVDVSSESINRAEKLNLEKVIFRVISEPTLPFADYYFDIIYSNGTFHHIPSEQHGNIFKELHRVLKKGGNLFVFENNPYNPLMVRAMKKNPFDAGVTMVKPDYLKQLFKTSGFIVRARDFYFFYPKFLKHLRFTEKYLTWLPLGAQYFVWGTK